MGEALYYFDDPDDNAVWIQFFRPANQAGYFFEGFLCTWEIQAVACCSETGPC